MCEPAHVQPVRTSLEMSILWANICRLVQNKLHTQAETDTCALFMILKSHRTRVLPKPRDTNLAVNPMQHVVYTMQDPFKTHLLASLLTTRGTAGYRAY